MRIWYRGIAYLFPADGSSEIPSGSSIAAELPLEIVEMIVAHLIYDTRSLLACSLTCYSWYIASVPHLHHTIVVRQGAYYDEPGFDWLTLLKNTTKFGLLPFVKKFRVRRTDRLPYPFTPARFNSRMLRQISGMTNIQELVIDDLVTSEFIPGVEHYFGHFLPRVRSLSLRAPTGSRRQVLFFIGLFEHLQDLTLIDERTHNLGTPASGRPNTCSTLRPPAARTVGDGAF